jgi:hypothetical protein
MIRAPSATEHPAAHNGCLLQSKKDDFVKLLGDFELAKSHVETVPNNARAPLEAHWNNPWFSALDAAALVCMLAIKSPQKYVEIGGGNSTKFARHAVSSAKISTHIISIDPQPRSEIDPLCDKIIRRPLEDLDPTYFDSLNAGDFLFFDGSHRVFTNSDVTALFFDVLPRLKAGVIVHIHDIFWPDDYPPDWTGRLYSEQYLLGMLWMSNTPRYHILLPNYFVSLDPSTAPLVKGLGIPTTYPGITTPGVSVWLKIV